MLPLPWAEVLRLWPLEACPFFWALALPLGTVVLLTQVALGYFLPLEWVQGPALLARRALLAQLALVVWNRFHHRLFYSFQNNFWHFLFIYGEK